MKDELTFLKLLGERMMIFRKRADLTQKQVAEAIQGTSVHYGRIERGKTNITIVNLIRIANALNLSLSDLVDVSSTHVKKKRIK